MYPEGYMSSHKRVVPGAPVVQPVGVQQSPLQPRKLDFTVDADGRKQSKKADLRKRPVVGTMSVHNRKNTVHFIPQKKEVPQNTNLVGDPRLTEISLSGSPMAYPSHYGSQKTMIPGNTHNAIRNLTTKVPSREKLLTQQTVPLRSKRTRSKQALELHVQPSMHRSITQQMRAEGTHNNSLETFSIMKKSGTYSHAHVYRDQTVQTQSQIPMSDIDRHVCALLTTTPLKHDKNSNYHHNLPYMTNMTTLVPQSLVPEETHSNANDNSNLPSDDDELLIDDAIDMINEANTSTSYPNASDDDAYDQVQFGPNSVRAHPTIQLPPSYMDETQQHPSSKKTKLNAVYLQNYPVIIYPAHSRFKHEKVTLDVSLYEVPEGFCYKDGVIHFVNNGSKQQLKPIVEDKRHHAVYTPISQSRKPSTLAAVRPGSTVHAASYASSYVEDPLDVSVAFGPTEIVAQRPSSVLKPSRRTVNAATLDVGYDTIPMNTNNSNNSNNNSNNNNNNNNNKRNNANNTSHPNIINVSQNENDEHTTSTTSVNSPIPKSIRSQPSSNGSIKVMSPTNDVHFSDELTIATSPTSESDGSVRLPVSVFQLDEDDQYTTVHSSSRMQSPASYSEYTSSMITEDLSKLDNGLVAGSSLGRMRAASSANLQTQHKIHTPTYSAGTNNHNNHNNNKLFQKTKAKKDNDDDDDDSSDEDDTTQRNNYASDDSDDNTDDDDNPFSYTQNTSNQNDLYNNSSLTDTRMMAQAVQHDEIHNEWVEFEVVEVELMAEDEVQVKLDNNHVEHVSTEGETPSDHQYSHEDSHSKTTVKMENCLVATGKSFLIFGALHIYPSSDVYIDTLAEGESVYSYQELLTVDPITGQQTVQAETIVINASGKKVKRVRKRRTTEHQMQQFRPVLKFIGTQVSEDNRKAMIKEVKPLLPKNKKQKKVALAVLHEEEDVQVVRLCNLIKGHKKWKQRIKGPDISPPSICHSPMSETFLDMKAALDYTASVLHTYSANKDWIYTAPSNAGQIAKETTLPGLTTVPSCKFVASRQVHGVKFVKHDLGGGKKHVAQYNSMDKVYWMSAKDTKNADICVSPVYAGGHKYSQDTIHSQPLTSPHYYTYKNTMCVNAVHQPKHHSFLAISGITQILDHQGMQNQATMAAFKKVVSALKTKEVFAMVSDTGKNEDMVHFPTNRKTGSPQYALVQSVEQTDMYSTHTSMLQTGSIYNGRSKPSETSLVSVDQGTRHLYLSTTLKGGELVCLQPPPQIGKSLITQLLGLNEYIPITENNTCGQCDCCHEGHKHTRTQEVQTPNDFTKHCEKPIYRHPDWTTVAATGGAGRRQSILDIPSGPAKMHYCADCGRIQLRGVPCPPPLQRGAVYDATSFKFKQPETKVKDTLIQGLGLFKILHNKALNLSKGTAVHNLSKQNNKYTTMLAKDQNFSPFDFSEADRDQLLLTALLDIETLANTEITGWYHSIETRAKDCFVQDEEISNFAKIVGDNVCKCILDTMLPSPSLDSMSSIVSSSNTAPLSLMMETHNISVVVEEEEEELEDAIIIEVVKPAVKKGVKSPPQSIQKTGGKKKSIITSSNSVPTKKKSTTAGMSVRA